MTEWQEKKTKNEWRADRQIGRGRDGLTDRRRDSWIIRRTENERSESRNTRLKSERKWEKVLSKEGAKTLRKINRKRQKKSEIPKMALLSFSSKNIKKQKQEETEEEREIPKMATLSFSSKKLSHSGFSLRWSKALYKNHHNSSHGEKKSKAANKLARRRTRNRTDWHGASQLYDRHWEKKGTLVWRRTSHMAILIFSFSL